VNVNQNVPENLRALATLGHYDMTLLLLEQSSFGNSTDNFLIP